MNPLTRDPNAHPHVDDARAWLDLETLATVELTSEHPAYPIEAALLPGNGPCWRADRPGPQEIRLLFEVPQQVSRIVLVFEETERERTQEIVLRWTRGGDHPAYYEVIRRQHDFSPTGRTRQVESHAVELLGVMGLELRIVPDLHHREAVAALSAMRLG